MSFYDHFTSFEETMGQRAYAVTELLGTDKWLLQSGSARFDNLGVPLKSTEQLHAHYLSMGQGKPLRVITSLSSDFTEDELSKTARTGTFIRMALDPDQPTRPITPQVPIPKNIAELLEFLRNLT